MANIYHCLRKMIVGVCSILVLERGIQVDGRASFYSSLLVQV